MRHSSRIGRSVHHPVRRESVCDRDGSNVSLFVCGENTKSLMLLISLTEMELISDGGEWVIQSSSTTTIIRFFCCSRIMASNCPLESMDIFLSPAHSGTTDQRREVDLQIFFRRCGNTDKREYTNFRTRSENTSMQIRSQNAIDHTAIMLVTHTHFRLTVRNDPTYQIFNRISEMETASSVDHSARSARA